MIKAIQVVLMGLCLALGSTAWSNSKGAPPPTLGTMTPGVFLTEAYVLKKTVDYSASVPVADYIAAVEARKCNPATSTAVIFPRRGSVGTVYLVCDER